MYSYEKIPFSVSLEVFFGQILKFWNFEIVKFDFYIFTNTNFIFLLRKDANLSKLVFKNL